MAKLECRLKGEWYQILSDIDSAVSRSVSASLEAESNFSVNGCRCVVRVYERYSWLGGNRVSLNITLLEAGDTIFLSAITSGGSQAIFFKVNTLGEESFLDKIANTVEKYRI